MHLLIRYQRRLNSGHWVKLTGFHSKLILDLTAGVSRRFANICITELVAVLFSLLMTNWLQQERNVRAPYGIFSNFFFFTNVSIFFEKLLREVFRDIKYKQCTVAVFVIGQTQFLIYWSNAKYRCQKRCLLVSSDLLLDFHVLNQISVSWAMQFHGLF